MLFSLILLAVCSFGLALLLTPLVRRGGMRAGWVDHPYGGRRLHSVPVAGAGGIAVVTAFLRALGVLMLSKALALTLAATTVSNGRLPLTGSFQKWNLQSSG